MIFKSGGNLKPCDGNVTSRRDGTGGVGHPSMIRGILP